MKQFEINMKKKYYLKHPLKLMEEVYYNVKWAVQRVFIGYDDREVFGFYDVFLEKTPEILMKIKKNYEGIPSLLYEDEMDYEEQEAMWKDILFLISKGLKSGKRFFDKNTKISSVYYDRLDDAGVDIFDFDNPKIDEIEEELDYDRKNKLELEALEVEFNEAMKLFVKYFGCLWL